MSAPSLIDSTGNRLCDKISRGVTGNFQITFPDRIRGVYLRGSHASHSSVDGSDLDLYLVFKDRFTDKAEYERARELTARCAELSPILLEIIPIGERGLRLDPVLGLNLKLATRLLYGEDIRPSMPDFDADTYRRSVVHTPYFSYSETISRREQGALVYPLQHIDPNGAFFGYDQSPVPGADGSDQPSTKLLVASVGWTATAIIALRTGRYVQDKAACAQLYQEHIADEWTDLVTDVHQLCRSRWRYLIPSADADRRTLRSLCNQALDFQNHYLRLYRHYQLAELSSGDPQRQQLAAQRLEEIVFPDPEVQQALADAGYPVANSPITRAKHR